MCVCCACKYLRALMAISREFWREGSPEQLVTWPSAFKCSRGFPTQTRQEGNKMYGDFMLLKSFTHHSARSVSQLFHFLSVSYQAARRAWAQAANYITITKGTNSATAYTLQTWEMGFWSKNSRINFSSTCTAKKKKKKNELEWTWAYPHDCNCIL